jgi:glutamine amidotransferase
VDKIIIPGVGAFKEGVANLNQGGLGEGILEFHRSGKSILGICLGYQLLTRSSTEFGLEKGLGLINAECRRLDPASGHSLPHVGWNSCRAGDPDARTFVGESSFYFVHSYGVFSEAPMNSFCTTEYGGQEFLSLIRHENILGVQFHPEKSGKDGLSFLKKFLDWN